MSGSFPEAWTCSSTMRLRPAQIRREGVMLRSHGFGVAALKPRSRPVRFCHSRMLSRNAVVAEPYAEPYYGGPICPLLLLSPVAVLHVDELLDVSLLASSIAPAQRAFDYALAQHSRLTLTHILSTFAQLSTDLRIVRPDAARRSR